MTQEVVAVSHSGTGTSSGAPPSLNGVPVANWPHPQLHVLCPVDAAPCPVLVVITPAPEAEAAIRGCLPCSRCRASAYTAAAALLRQAAAEVTP